MKVMKGEYMKVMKQLKDAKKSTDVALLLVRLALGIVFVMHGWQKISEMGVAGFSGVLSSLGVPFPTLNAAIVLALEFGGGLAMLAGVLARPIGVLLAFNMLVAAATVHARNGFFLPAGYEFTLVLGLASLAITAAGAGAYSVDALFRRDPVTVSPVREKIAA